MAREGLPNNNQENKANEKEEAQKRALIPLLILGKTYEALGLIENRNIPPEVVQSQEVQDAAKKGLISKLSLGQAEAASEVFKMFDISQDFIEDPLVQEAAQEGISKWLSQQDAPKALKIKERFKVSDEFFNSAVVKAMAGALFIQENEKFNKLKDGFKSSEQMVQDAAKMVMLKCLNEKNLRRALVIKDDFKIPQKIIKGPEVQEIVIRVMNEELSHGEHRTAKSIKEKFDVSDKSLQNPEVQDAIKKAILNIFSRSYINNSKELLELKKNFNFSDEVLQSLEIQEAIKKGAIKSLSEGDLNKFLDFKKEFNFSKEYLQGQEVQDAAIKGVAYNLHSNNPNKAQKIKEKFKLSEEMFLDGVKEAMIKHLDSFSSGFHKVLELKEKFNISDEVVQDVAKKGIVRQLSGKYTSSALEIINKFNVSPDVVQSPEVQKYVHDIILSYTTHPDGRKFLDAVEIAEKFSVSEDFLQSPEMQDSARRGLIYYLAAGNDIESAIKIKKGFRVNQEIMNSVQIQGEVKKLFLDKLRRSGDTSAALKIKRELGVPEETIQSSEVQEVVRKLFIQCLSAGNLSEALKLKDNLEIPETFIQSPEIQTTLEARVRIALSRGGFGYISKAREIQSGFNVPEERMKKAAMSAVIQIISTTADVEAIVDIKKTFNILDSQIKDHLIEFVAKEKIPFGVIKDGRAAREFFTQNILGPSWRYIDTLTLGENVLMKKRLAVEQRFSLYKIDELEIVYEPQGERDYEYMFENIKELKGSVWTQEGHEIKRAFEQGCLYFGYKKMFQFVGGKNHHDKLFAFEKIIRMAQKSGLKPEQFYANILLQVKHDTGNYGESADRGSYQKLNNIADIVSGIDILEKLKKAREYDITKIRELVDQIKKPEDIFTNWKSLKNFTDLVELLNKSVILDQLKGLSAEGKEELQSYVEYLAFHPNINTQSVIEFWQRPGRFLGTGDGHSSKLHELKKPSNYIDIPYMDLKPEDLRDALVEGSLDKIQAWQPLEIEYKIPQGEFARLSFVDQIKKALGSRSEKIPGMAKEPGVLFKKLNDICKQEGLQLLAVLKGEVEIPDNLMDEFQETLYNEEYGLVLPSKEYRVKIGRKSDPEVVVAGNDTACCMPFGSGKNNVYTYNPVCGQMIVQRKIKDGWRTVAQSVVTKNKDIKKNVSSVVHAFTNDSGASLSETFSDDLLLNDKDIMTCDNIEVSPNFRDRSDLEVLYRDFFTEYAGRFGESENLDTSRLVVGASYADLTVGRNVENTFVPVAPMGYSDNTGSSTMMVDLEKNKKRSLQKRVSVENIPGLEKVESEVLGISGFTHRDTLIAAYIEGKAYSDNPSLKEYLHNIENGLIAKDILNSHFNLPEMSLKYEDNNKKVQGYLLAYEGHNKSGENIIYIADLAANTESKLAGGRLIQAFAERYKKLYIDKNKALPIMVDARDKTSYNLIIRQLENIGKNIGVKFELEELASYRKGADTMHTVIIRSLQESVSK